MTLVIHQLEVCKGEGEQVLDVRVDLHGRQGQRLAGHLQIRLIQVVRVEMRVTQRVDEIARMLSGDRVTEEARAAARALLAG